MVLLGLVFGQQLVKRGKQIVVYTDYLALILALQWMPQNFLGRVLQNITGHAGYVGNLKADELARSAVADCVWKSRKLFIYIPNKNVDSQKKKEQIVNPETFVKIPISFDDILRNDKSNDFKT
uniref:RNase H type-1 domain-containing protein n=1 Tax=Ditylenchus dipsaci TaxID=166011 RepID=A0A915D337_9BILA